MLKGIGKRSKFVSLGMAIAILGSVIAAVPAYAIDENYPLVDGGIYYIQNMRSGKVLDVVNESKDLRAAIIQWDWWNGNNQKWIAKTEGLKTYSFRNKNSNMVLESPWGNNVWGTILQQWGYNGGDNQKWYLHYGGNSSNADWFTLRNKQNWLCIDVNAGSRSNGERIIQWEYNNADNQLWQFVRIGSIY
jgi:hypothetical protein